MSGQSEKIKQYFNERAKTYGSSLQTNYVDFNLRLLEVRKTTDYLTKKPYLLDAGCGNGDSTFRFAAHFNKIIGLDYSEEMIKNAHFMAGEKDLLNKVDFVLGSVCDLPFPKNFFDTVISMRCITNVPDVEMQKQAILEIKRVLKPDGKLLITDATVEGREGLNRLRIAFGLKPLPIVWHNRPFEADMIEYLKSIFSLETEYGFGLYYLISRIFHPLFVKPDEPQYESKINEVASDLAYKVDLLREISVVKLFILSKK